MKTRLLVMVGMMISTTIFAQKVDRDSRKPEESGYERMKRELALTADQSASIKGIDSKYTKKRDDQRTKFERKRFEEKETMKAFRLDRDREIHKVLTPDQRVTWDRYKADQKKGHQKHKMSGHRKHGHNRKHNRHEMRDDRNAHRHRK